jgi:hypothetical protein
VVAILTLHQTVQNAVPVKETPAPIALKSNTTKPEINI